MLYGMHSVITLEALSPFQQAAKGYKFSRRAEKPGKWLKNMSN